MTVTGRFTDVECTIPLDEHAPITAEAGITMAATSLDTTYPRRARICATPTSSTWTGIVRLRSAAGASS
jgi:polyisoprenoid-binding protein YceI